VTSKGPGGVGTPRMEVPRAGGPGWRVCLKAPGANEFEGQYRQRLLFIFKRGI
jgi:hypothetical protein